MRQAHIAVLLIIMFLILPGCGEQGSAATPQPVTAAGATTAALPTATPEPATLAATTARPAAAPTAPPTRAATLTATAVPATMPPAPTATADPLDLLAAVLSLDSDGNGVPDLIETEAGYDPHIDDCALGQCGAATAAGLELLTIQQNVLIVLDASGSMGELTADGRVKMDVAKETLARYVAATPDIVHLGLLVYGHQGNGTDAGKPASCAGVEVVAPLGTLDYASAAATLGRFEPTGWTPIAGALTAALDAFAGSDPEATNTVILITDGLETCAGDPVAAAAALRESQVNLTVDVVGFDVGSADAAPLQGIASAGGGTYFDAGDGSAFSAYFENLAQQRLDTIAALECARDNRDNRRACVEQIAADARIIIDDYERQARAADRDELADALRGLRTIVRQGALADHSATFDALMVQVDALIAQLQEIERRLNE